MTNVEAVVCVTKAAAKAAFFSFVAVSLFLLSAFIVLHFDEILKMMSEYFAIKKMAPLELMHGTMRFCLEALLVLTCLVVAFNALRQEEPLKINSEN